MTIVGNIRVEFIIFCEAQEDPGNAFHLLGWLLVDLRVPYTLSFFYPIKLFVTRKLTR